MYRLIGFACKGAGGTIMQMLMERFGCEVIGLNVDETGVFAHTPEPVYEETEDDNYLPT